MYKYIVCKLEFDCTHKATFFVLFPLYIIIISTVIRFIFCFIKITILIKYNYFTDNKNSHLQNVYSSTLIHVYVLVFTCFANVLHGVYTCRE